MDQIINYLNKSTKTLNENKYFIGFTMILLNIGARFIIDELDDDLREIISNKYIRRFFIFCSFFMATKDIFTSLILTIVFVIIINEFLVTEKDETKQGKKQENGTSFNKKELDKTIQKLKTIQMTM